VNLVLFIDNDGAVDPGTNRDDALLELGRQEQWRASGLKAVAHRMVARIKRLGAV